jgi:tRNA modification GTPase
MKCSTIAAISTPYGSGGIGIIRISGDESIKIAKTLFRRSRLAQEMDTEKQDALKSHRMYHGFIVDPSTQRQIDEVLVVVMKAPKSYTREDVVEIHSHAGYIVLSHIFEKVISTGAKIAEPGEFTKRAFLNGRIDLTQAEAVSDIINAKSTTALRMATIQLEGRLREQLDDIRSALNEIHVLLEAAIDFPEESEEIHLEGTVIRQLTTKILPGLKGLIQRHRQEHYFREGVRMAVIGKPNVGKSSLLNRLMDTDRAIVTAIPGTTRDVIEETINVKGLPVIIMDTAGLQDAVEEVERLGIAKTLASIENADLILFVVDLSRALSSEDLRIYHQIKEKRHIVVQNKCDLLNAGEGVSVPNEFQESPTVAISALKGIHIDALRAKIRDIVIGKRGVVDEISVVPNARHQGMLKDALASAENAFQEFDRHAPAEIIAIDIKEAIDDIDRITGRRHSEDLLDQIFGRFCIGK